MIVLHDNGCDLQTVRIWLVTSSFCCGDNSMVAVWPDPSSLQSVWLARLEYIHVSLFIISEKVEVLSALVNPINITTFIIKHRLSPQDGESQTFSRYVCMYQSRPWFMQPNWTPAKFYVNLWVLMHWYTCQSLLNTLGSAVEHLAVCLSKQASQQWRSLYNSHVTPATSDLFQTDAQMSSDIGHAHNSTHRMRLSPGTLRDPFFFWLPELWRYVCLPKAHGCLHKIHPLRHFGTICGLKFGWNIMRLFT